MKKKVATLLGLLIATSVFADDAKLQDQLEKMGATNIKISDSPLPNFRSVVSDQGVLQISEDGRFVIEGSVLELKDGTVSDITNRPLMAELESMKKEMIIFPAKNQKHTVTVFTDISCGYCKLLHSQMKEYNDLGITIRYLAFPRAGLRSQTARQMEAIWQAEDRNHSLHQAESGHLPAKQLTPKLIKKQYDLGIKFGIRGTPNIITSEGEVIGGYVEPKQLLQMLEK
ncbi:Thiol:disulfide interchange protein DsbC precursor [Phocoenobacter uteri]|uniref:Thiol:disulfide interchange protein n=1 Tax=Phocoenobacter uteri TaxID=146806 RepID=A0A379CBS2_9PAST|nr:bifunctional protein-disulfide isomerase/oxidoreductase DsbC [Phocoenobacter uteri]MDG6881153.1 protein-disulfide isomerase [Phocoenobacter uteri]SUB59175.1 Thiol:disulfide interchange protein DsbC precursor [Phocoenobacter uteri]